MAFNWKEVKELYPLAYDHLREGWSWSANPSGVETGLQIKHYLKKEHSLKSQGISQVLKQFEQKLSTEKGMEDESFKLTHKQDLALKRFERALRALDDAESLSEHISNREDALKAGQEFQQIVRGIYNAN
mgnify:CR=1 FL=1